MKYHYMLKTPKNLSTKINFLCKNLKSVTMDNQQENQIILIMIVGSSEIIRDKYNLISNVFSLFLSD
jgi:hypothetical protein